MKVPKNRFPNRESYSVSEIAAQWECEVSQVESYIFDYKLCSG